MPKIVDSCGCVICGSDSDSDSEEEEIQYPFIHKSGITVDELIAYLQDLKEKNKKIGTYIIQHVEMGALTESKGVAVDSDIKCIVIHSYY